MGYGVWATWAMGPMGNVNTEGNGVQGVWGTWAMGYMGNGVQGYESHGKRRPMGDLHPKCQKDVKLSKRCQVVKKMSNVKK